jgi:alkanesulfonate monooxygenase SsuD/methylene tetrahydromethanopterin reductase-like flavin-dependent oxidoreductase (luciferase family)
MRFGLLYDFRNPKRWEQPAAQLYAELLDQIAYAEQLGFDSVWITEHHFIEDGYTPSVLTIAAAIAARTSRIRIGTWVLLLPLHNALRVAEDAATVDVLSNGRLDLGLGLGYRLEEFAAFGVDRRQRGRLMDEGIELIRRAWTEDRVTFDGRFYKVQDAPGPMRRMRSRYALRGSTLPRCRFSDIAPASSVTTRTGRGGRCASTWTTSPPCTTDGTGRRRTCPAMPIASPVERSRQTPGGRAT